MGNIPLKNRQELADHASFAASSMGSTYLKTLRERAKESKVYQSHQMVGLEISQLLADEKHKALYIKLAKEGNTDRLMRIAKEVAEKKDVKNKGAYFMTVLQKK